MKFLCLGYYDEKKFSALPKAELEALSRKCGAHDEELVKTGKVINIASLEATRQAISIRPRKGKPTVTDGPYSEAKEVIGSFFLIEARDREEAVRIASLHPAALLGEELGWGLEVRGVDYYSEPR